MSGAVPEEAAMNRSKLSLKAIMLMSGIGLAAAALGGSQPAAAQSYSDDYGYSPYYGGYGSYYAGPHSDFGHGFTHGMGGLTHDFGGGGGHGAGFAHAGGGGFAHGGGGGHR